MHRRLLLAVLAATVLAPAAPAQAQTAPPAPWLEWCGTRWCGTFTVPEDPALPGGRTVGLNVVVIPATRPALRTREAITLLGGGPGQAATSAAGMLPPLLAKAHERHDIVLVDQRGTGDSKSLFCPVATVLPEAPTPEQVRAWWSSCLGGLDADPRRYTTSAAVDDLDAVRETLGYERLHLYGGSYGAVAVQYYLLRHGEHAATAVLDSGPLLDSRLFERWARSYQDVFDRLAARCGRRAACHAAFPSPVGDLETVLARLARAPVRVGGIAVDRDVFAGIVSLLTESSVTARVVPLFVHTAATDGVPASFRAIGPELLDLVEVLALREPLVMLYAIVCTEPWGKADPGEVARLSAGTYLGPTYVAQQRVWRAICDATPRGLDTAGSDERVRSELPVLVTMGAEDPKLPATTVAGIHRTMPNAAVAVVRTSGHGTLGNPCILRLANRLITTGTTAGLDTGCARKQSFRPLVLRWDDWFGLS